MIRSTWAIVKEVPGGTLYLTEKNTWTKIAANALISGNPEFLRGVLRLREHEHAFVADLEKRRSRR